MDNAIIITAELSPTATIARRTMVCENTFCPEKDSLRASKRGQFICASKVQLWFGLRRTIILMALLMGAICNSTAQNIITGAARTDLYLSLLKKKRVAVVANQTSIVQDKHLVDTLLAAKVKVKKVFAPEHGFRGQAANGEKVNNATDAKTGLPIISLYGKNVKPTRKDLKNVDVVLFDIQDVGVRFYTYLTTFALCDAGLR